MKAEVAYPLLLATARALKPYSTPANTVPRWRASSRLLHLHVDGDTVTMTASTGDETAGVALPGAVPDGSSHGSADGAWALPPDTLINALAVIKPAGRAAARATVTMAHDADRLHLSIGDGPTIDLDTETPPEPAPAIPAAVGQLVTAGTVADWCDLIAGAATAASREPARRELAVVRLHRDYPRTVLVVEATDTRRVHRGIWRGPGSDLGTEPVDVRIPVEAAVRAVRLLRTLDPTGHIRVRADDRLTTWRTDRVHVSARTGGAEFPDLEKLREDVLDDATTRFSVERAALLTVLDTAHRLTAPAKQPRIRLERPDPDVLNVVVLSTAGTAVYTGQLPVTAATGPVHHMLLNPDFARYAVGFLDGDTITVHSSPDWLPTYLTGARRHAIVMRVRG